MINNQEQFPGINTTLYTVVKASIYLLLDSKELIWKSRRKNSDYNCMKVDIHSMYKYLLT